MANKPVPTGKYAVGTITYTVYNDREEVLAPGTMRSVPARVYYPCEKAAVQGRAKSRYMTRDVAAAIKKYMNAPINYDKIEAAGENVSDCYENAPRIPGENFPLIMFNHGLASYREANSFLCLELASQGYVVISVGHPYDGASTQLDDGTAIELYKETMKKQYEPFLPGAAAILKLTMTKASNRELAEKFDILQKKYCRYINSRIEEWTKDTLTALAYAKENLTDLIDFGCGIGVTGHSMGGATAYMLCLDHEEFVCGVNLDGAPFGNNKGKIQRKPFLQISCKINLRAETRAFIDHSDVVYGALFDKMQHIAFSDMKHMIPIKLLVGGMDPDVMHESVCRLHREMFDTYLKKTKDHPVIQGSEGVTITEYPPDVVATD
ncbi:MAG: hypothetical protein IK078_03730 [Lachnospiraceae bacterium]|nr:hypothetical protein [Lachnospiraceae bacterium]